jgi:PAS domain S-box-containing protein
MLIIDVAYNLTFLIAFAVISGFLENRIPGRTTLGMVLQGLLFGTAVVIGILYPFVLSEGLIFDGRSVTVSLATLFFGPITGLIAALMAVVTRAYIGGAGVVMGVSVAILAFLIGLGFRRFWDKTKAPTLKYLFMMGVGVHFGMIGLMVLLPTNVQQETFTQLALTIIIFYPIATVITGKVLTDQLEIRHLYSLARENEEKFRAIFNSTNEAIFLHDAETGMIVDFNDRTLDLYKLDTREKVLNNFVRNISSGDENYNPEKGLENLRKAIELGSYTFDWYARSGDNHLFWVEVSLRYIKIADKGHVIAVVRNIDDRKKQEEMTMKNLREKEVLLAEIHHRVKNNLAIISGLIGLQLDTVSDSSAREILEETDKRIRSISLVHELVYNNEQLESVDFATFLHELIPILDTFSNQQNKPIEIVIDAKPVQVELNKSVPCALITTEILTNCYKHAFKNMDSGNVTITLRKSEDRVSLVIQDDGRGIDDIESLREGESFGYTIINGLTQQIGGVITFENTHPGLRVTLTF